MGKSKHSPPVLAKYLGFCHARELFHPKTSSTALNPPSEMSNRDKIHYTFIIFADYLQCNLRQVAKCLIAVIT